MSTPQRNARAGADSKSALFYFSETPFFLLLPMHAPARTVFHRRLCCRWACWRWLWNKGSLSLFLDTHLCQGEGCVFLSVREKREAWPQLGVSHLISTAWLGIIFGRRLRLKLHTVFSLQCCHPFLWSHGIRLAPVWSLGQPALCRCLYVWHFSKVSWHSKDFKGKHSMSGTKYNSGGNDR